MGMAWEGWSQLSSGRCGLGLAARVCWASQRAGRWHWPAASRGTEGKKSSKSLFLDADSSARWARRHARSSCASVSRFSLLLCLQE